MWWLGWRWWIWSAAAWVNRQGVVSTVDDEAVAGLVIGSGVSIVYVLLHFMLRPEVSLPPALILATSG